MIFGPRGQSLTDSANGLYSCVRVTWDKAKSRANFEKHGVSFEEARQLFTGGAHVLEIFDELHSELEDRFIAIGPIARGIVLVVWTEREDDVIRIISARWASRREESFYFEFLERSS